MTEEVNKIPLYKAIMTIRVELQKKNLRKSGKNSFAGFDYFELADFMPTLNELMLEHGVGDNFSITDEMVTLTLTNGEEHTVYSLPFKQFETPKNKNNQKQMQDIQYFGALDTYYKRYIYMNAFGITDGDVIDAMNNKEFATNNQTMQQPSPKINQSIVKGYNQAIQEVIERTGKNDGSVMRWFLKQLQVVKIEDITLEQTELADKLIERLKIGKKHD